MKNLKRTSEFIHISQGLFVVMIFFTGLMVMSFSPVVLDIFEKGLSNSTLSDFNSVKNFYGSILAIQVKLPGIWQPTVLNWITYQVVQFSTWIWVMLQLGVLSIFFRKLGEEKALTQKNISRFQLLGIITILYSLLQFVLALVSSQPVLAIGQYEELAIKSIDWVKYLFSFIEKEGLVLGLYFALALMLNYFLIQHKELESSLDENKLTI